MRKVIAIIAVILIADQVLKIYIKTSFELDQTMKIFSWFELLFVENDGMAWGAKISDFMPWISDRAAKIILTSFRICAVIGIGYWLYDSVKNNASRLLKFSLALIFAGAMGNIIDSMFYGVIFSDSYGQVATFWPEDIDWGALGRGRVVDMFHLPIWQGELPSWIPFIGGDYFVFFQPVFNIADVAISLGVGILIFFNKRAFSIKKQNYKSALE